MKLHISSYTPHYIGSFKHSWYDIHNKPITSALIELHLPIPGTTATGFIRSACGCITGERGGPLPSLWLTIVDDVGGYSFNKGDIQRRLFGIPATFSSIGRLLLFWGPDTNSSASSIIIPCNTNIRNSRVHKDTSLCLSINNLSINNLSSHTKKLNKNYITKMLYIQHSNFRTSATTWSGCNIDYAFRFTVILSEMQVLNRAWWN